MIPKDDLPLLLAYIRGELPMAEAVQVQSRLAGEPLLARQLMQIALDEVALTDWADVELQMQQMKSAHDSQQAAQNAALPAPIDPSSIGEFSLGSTGSTSAPFAPTGSSGIWWVSRCTRSLGLLLAIGLTGLIGLAYWLWPAGNLGTGPIIARIQTVQDAVWSEDNPRVSVGAGVPRGWNFDLRSGSAEIVYPHGATLRLQGPTTLTMTDAMSSQLQAGQVTAYVPPAAVGYTITTPGLEIKDKGTRFGVRLDESARAEVHVFEGEVEAQTSNQADKPAVQPLLMTQAAKFDRHGKLLGWIPPDYGTFAAANLAQGIVSTNRHIRWLTQSPNSLEQNRAVDENHILLIAERKNVELQGPLAATFQQPMGGTRSAYSKNVAMIPAGTRVDSYLVHFNSEKNPMPVDGEVKFDRPILAIIARGDQLVRTDKLLGLDSITYEPNAAQRGLKGGEDKIAPDVLNVNDPKTLGVRIESVRHQVAELRVLVASPN